MFYDRKIKYLDYLENGDKIRSAGFVKIEVADELCNIQVNITGLYSTDTFSREVWISNGSRETVLGQINLQAGRGQVQWKRLFTASLGRDKIPYEELAQIRIKLAHNRVLWCKWSDCENRKLPDDEMVVSASAMAPVEEKIEEASLREVTDLNEKKSCNIMEKSRAEWKYVQAGFYETVDKDRDIRIDIQEIQDSDQSNLIADGKESEEIQERQKSSIGQTSVYDRLNYDKDPQQEENAVNYAVQNQQVGQKEQISLNSTSVREERLNPDRQSVRENQLNPDKQPVQEEQPIQNSTTFSVGQEWRAAVAKEQVKFSEILPDRDERQFEPSERPDGTLYVQWMAPDEKRQSDFTPKPYQRDADTRGVKADVSGRTDAELVNAFAEEKEFVCPRQPEAAVAQKNPVIPKQLYEDKWKQLSFLYPHISPFHDERDYLSVGPGDFVVLQRGYHKLVNNSFLLHGYYNYEHLILARMTKRGEEHYYVGVPGNFYEREKQVAVMFGFESFECKKEPAQTGDFGYYMIRVEI